MKKDFVKYASIFVLMIFIWVGIGWVVQHLKKTNPQDPVGFEKAPEQQVVQDDGDDNGKAPFSEDVKFDESKINEENPFAKKMVVVYDSACREAKHPACDLEKLNQFLYMDFQETQDNIAFVNNQHKSYQEFAKTYDFTKPSPILFLSDAKVKEMKDGLNKALEKAKAEKNEQAIAQAQEVITNLTKEFSENNHKNGFYAISLSTWLIDEKNVCDKEDDWKAHKSCALAYVVTDPNCPADEYEACKPDLKENIEQVAGKRLFIKMLTKDQAKDLLKYNTKGTYPFMVIKQQKDAEPQFLTETMSLRNEMEQIDDTTFYATPSFLKTEWRDDSKICTPDVAKVSKEPNKYLSCQDASCAGKNSCEVETKNKLTMYTMGYCPYCKPVAKRLVEFKKKHPEATIDIVHLVQPTTVTPTNLDEIQSLHGASETVEGARQYCIGKEFGESQLLNYLATRFEDSNIKDESNLEKTYASTKIDKNKVEACMKIPATAKALAERANKAYQRGIQGTPTFMVNNKYTVMGGYNEMLQGYEQYNK